MEGQLYSSDDEETDPYVLGFSGLLQKYSSAYARGGGTGLAADAGGHISTEARVVISSWLVQIVVLPS